MPRKTTETWFQLCNLAAIEEDPVKLLKLVQEICRLLKEKEASLKRTIRSANPARQKPKGK